MLFYILNFSYIFAAVMIGIYLGNTLPQNRKGTGRRVTQLMVGLYMLVFLGVIGHENMQLEGFFIYLMLGLFQAAVIHYAVAKIVGPLFFGRGWCGYACWTAMVFDYLPHKIPAGKRLKGWGHLRYLHFFLSFALILYLGYFSTGSKWVEGSTLEWQLFLLGNGLYYASGITLAYLLKDNRAFCKYLCPIPTLQKIGSRFALLKVEIDSHTCVNCQLCEKQCPMNIRLLTYKNRNQRVLSTECVLCQNCIHICPKQAIKITARLDAGFKEELDT